MVCGALRWLLDCLCQEEAFLAARTAADIDFLKPVLEALFPVLRGMSMVFSVTITETGVTQFSLRIGQRDVASWNIAAAIEGDLASDVDSCDDGRGGDDVAGLVSTPSPSPSPSLPSASVRDYGEGDADDDADHEDEAMGPYSAASAGAAGVSELLGVSLNCSSSAASAAADAPSSSSSEEEEDGFHRARRPLNASGRRIAARRKRKAAEAAAAATVQVAQQRSAAAATVQVAQQRSAAAAATVQVAQQLSGAAAAVAEVEYAAEGAERPPSSVGHAEAAAAAAAATAAALLSERARVAADATSVTAAAAATVSCSREGVQTPASSPASSAARAENAREAVGTDAVAEQQGAFVAAAYAAFHPPAAVGARCAGACTCGEGECASDAASVPYAAVTRVAEILAHLHYLSRTGGSGLAVTRLRALPAGDTRVSAGIPSAHAFAHGCKCRFCRAGRNVKEMGRPDEYSEELNRYFSALAKQLTSLSPGAFDLMFQYLVVEINRQRNLKVAETLLRRVVRLLKDVRSKRAAADAAVAAFAAQQQQRSCAQAQLRLSSPSLDSVSLGAEGDDGLGADADAEPTDNAAATSSVVGAAAVSAAAAAASAAGADDELNGAHDGDDASRATAMDADAEGSSSLSESGSSSSSSSERATDDSREQENYGLGPEVDLADAAVVEALVSARACQSRNEIARRRSNHVHAVAAAVGPLSARIAALERCVGNAAAVQRPANKSRRSGTAQLPALQLAALQLELRSSTDAAILMGNEAVTLVSANAILDRARLQLGSMLRSIVGDTGDSADDSIGAFLDVDLHVTRLMNRALQLVLRIRSNQKLIAETGTYGLKKSGTQESNRKHWAELSLTLAELKVLGPASPTAAVVVWAKAIPAAEAAVAGTSAQLPTRLGPLRFEQHSMLLDDALDKLCDYQRSQEELVYAMGDPSAALENVTVLLESLQQQQALLLRSEPDISRTAGFCGLHKSEHAPLSGGERLFDLPLHSTNTPETLKDVAAGMASHVHAGIATMSRIQQQLRHLVDGVTALRSFASGLSPLKCDATSRPLLGQHGHQLLNGTLPPVAWAALSTEAYARPQRVPRVVRAGGVIAAALSASSLSPDVAADASGASSSVEGGAEQNGDVDDIVDIDEGVGFASSSPAAAPSSADDDESDGVDEDAASDADSDAPEPETEVDNNSSNDSDGEDADGTDDANAEDESAANVRSMISGMMRAADRAIADATVK